MRKSCRNCNAEFETKGVRVTCSMRCRFEILVSKDADENGCRRWLGCFHPLGYGMFTKADGKTEAPHRIQWRFHFGEIPAETPHVLHRCDHRWCVEISHLFLGTNADNVADRHAKGRSSHGEKHRLAQLPAIGRQAKLTVDQVREIKRRIAAGERMSAIAPDFGVSYGAIKRIRSGLAWSHVSLEPAT